MERVGIHDNFFDLGGRSLTAVRLFARIEEELGVNLPISALLQGPTIAQLAELIERTDEAVRWPSLVLMQAGAGPALFCVHGVRGDILRFHELTHRLDTGRPIYSLRARGLDGLQAPHESIEDMAADYAAEIVAAQPQGPYHIVGYSFGGLVAYEIARELTRQGREIALVGLIDTRRRVTRPLMLLNLLLLPFGQKVGYFRTVLRGRINDWRLGVGRLEPEAQADKSAATSRPRRMDRVWHASLRAAGRYEPKPYEGRVTLFRAKEQLAPAVMKRVSFPWEELAQGGFDVEELPCDHANILVEPEVRLLAGRLEAKLAETGAPGRQRRGEPEPSKPVEDRQSAAPPLKQSQRIVKNVLATGLSTVIGGLIQLAALVIVGRTVSVDEFGVYSFILAFAMFVWVLADSGLSTILVRELATKPSKMAEILGAAMTLIWVLSIVGELLILAVVPFLHLTTTDKVLTAVMGLVTMTQFHCAGYSAALRSREDNDIQALGFLLHKVLFFIFIVAGLKAGLALIGVVAAHLIPNLCLWAFFRRMVVKRYGHPRLMWDFAQWKYLLTHSLPVGGATMLRLAAEQADVLIIKLLSDIRTVGLFSGPYRISMAMRLIPQTMTVPLYPMYARLAQEEGARLPFLDAYHRSVKFFLLIAFPVAAVFIIFSGQLLTILLKADYLAAIPAMQLLGLAFIPFFLSTAFPLMLTALHEQRFLLKTAAFSLALRVLLNFALVPHYGFLGPCIAFLTSEIIAVTLWVNKLQRLGFPLGIWSILWRLTAATVCMAALLYPLQGRPLWLVVPAAGVASLIYLAVVWKLGTFTAKDLELAIEGSGFLKRFLGERPRTA